MNIVTISSDDKIKNSAYWCGNKRFNTAFDSNGKKICDFNISGNHSIAMINNVAGIEVRKDNDTAFWWGVPAETKAKLVFSYDGHKYYKFIR